MHKLFFYNNELQKFINCVSHKTFIHAYVSNVYLIANALNLKDGPANLAAGEFYLHQSADKPLNIDEEWLRQGKEMSIDKRTMLYSPILSLEKILHPGEIHRGKYGATYAAVLDKKSVAIRQVLVREHIHLPVDVFKEQDMLTYLKNERIINLQGVFHKKECTFFVLDLCLGITIIIYLP